MPIYDLVAIEGILDVSENRITALATITHKKGLAVSGYDFIGVSKKISERLFG
jgi:hypothetical protein